MKAKLLMLLLPATIKDDEIAGLIGKIKANLKEGSTPILLDESDFFRPNTANGFSRNAYNVRETFYRAVTALNDACGNPGEKSYFQNFLRCYVGGSVDKIIIDTLKSANADEMAWLTSNHATYLIKLIERLPQLSVE